MSVRACPTCGGFGVQAIESLSPRVGRVNYERVHRLFHLLWTQAASLPEYRKADWKELANAIEVLATDGMGPKGGAPRGGGG